MPCHKIESNNILHDTRDEYLISLLILVITGRELFFRPNSLLNFKLAILRPDPFPVHPPAADEVLQFQLHFPSGRIGAMELWALLPLAAWGVSEALVYFFVHRIHLEHPRITLSAIDFDFVFADISNAEAEERIEKGLDKFEPTIVDIVKLVDGAAKKGVLYVLSPCGGPQPERCRAKIQQCNTHEYSWIDGPGRTKC